MDTDDLRIALENLGIDSTLYSLNGTKENCYCLDHGRYNWSVYFYERGVESGKKIFQTEDEACTYFLNWLSSEPL